MTKKIDYQHPQYVKSLPKWKTIDEVCDGENLQRHLVKINPDDDTKDNITRNTQYFLRAVFYAIAGYTVRGMIGMMFRKWPKSNAPDQLDYIKNNIDGAGNSIYQQSQAVAKSVIRKGRAGLLADFPQTGGAVSQADIKEMRVFPTVLRFEPEQIIDWEVTAIGANIRLSRVALVDSVMEDDKVIHILRILSLKDGIYTSTEYRSLGMPGWATETGVGVSAGTPTGWEFVSESVPTDNSGKPWEFIPFTFVGSETNSPAVDQPPMMDLVRINIGHYNNSAEHEDIVFQAGQPQPWMSGISQDYLDLMKAEKMYVGSGRMMGVPAGEQFGVVQIAPNSAAREAMKDKTEAMIGLGAMHIQPGSAVKTAMQSEGEQQVQHSILSLIASNISEAYTQCVKWMCRYAGADDSEVEYYVNQDYLPKNADAQMLQQMVAAWMGNALPFSDLVKWLQKKEIVDPEKSIEDVQAEIGANAPEMPNLDAVDA